MKMIDKVAIQLFDKWMNSNSKYKSEWETCNDYTKDFFKVCAKAAIEAMREPSEGMIKEIINKHGHLQQPYFYANIWNTGIDAALKEELK